MRVVGDVCHQRENHGGRLGDESGTDQGTHGVQSLEYPPDGLNGGGYNARMPKSENAGRLIAENRRARHEYFIEERHDAGLVLEGWEVKAMRAGRAQLAEAYVYIRGSEAFLIGAHISPLKTASTHRVADPVRSRKLLLHRNELDRLISAVERRGYTIMPLELYWQHGRAKLQIGLAKGKQKQDKRATEKDRDWQRSKARVLRGR